MTFNTTNSHGNEGMNNLQKGQQMIDKVSNLKQLGCCPIPRFFSIACNLEHWLDAKSGGHLVAHNRALSSRRGNNPRNVPPGTF
ncbi:hypothetical protein TcasGA2_TC012705 [Tribolium castaneum]|uniref:Uncharacterized protein n=1 Tax=Tribolium castaneum TaxID=7070 RepID=D6WZQ8_TRICA|nr:hypothetical protein TcasGA2_TC012705 [Tribolium castaneum]